MARENDEPIENDESLLDDLPEVSNEEPVLKKDEDDDATNFSGDEPDRDEEAPALEAEGALLDEEEPAPKDDDKDLELRDRVYRERRVRFEEVAQAEAKTEEANTRAMKADLRATDIELKSIDRELAGMRADLEEAQEKGESKKVADSIDALADLRARKQALEKDKVSAASEIEKREKNPANPNATAWTKLNPWYNDHARYATPRYEKMRAATAEVDAQLYNEKRLNPMTPDYFRELDRRLRAKVPEAFGKKARPSEDNRQERRDAPRGPAPVRSSPSGGGGQGSGRVTIGPAQQKAMREMHLDPGNKAHVAEWVKQVRLEQKRTSK